MLDAADNTAIHALIATALAENGGVLSKNEFNGTAAIIRQLKEGVDGLRASNPMEALVTAGIVEKRADGTYGPKSAVAAPLKKDEVPAWQTQIDALVAQGAAKDKALLAATTEREASDMKNAVIAAFTAAGGVNPARDYLHVLPGVKRAADGTYHTITKDQFGVETPIALDVAFGTFLKGNPELAKPTGRPGSGTPAGGGFTPGSTTASREQISDPAWYAKNREALIAGTIQVVG
jgi:hypothetical protein